MQSISEKIVDAILSDPFFERNNLIAKCKSVLSGWVKANDRPLNYDEPKSDYGKLQKTIEARGIEKEFWRAVVIDIIGKDKMQPHYDQLREKLIEGGYLVSKK